MIANIADWRQSSCGGAMAMKQQRRKAKRKPFGWDAWAISAGGMMAKCTVENISDTGARLNPYQGEVLPDTFTLAFTPTVGPFRDCEVVWRRAGQVGVRFVGVRTKAP